ncbi:uncharacterized protein LOC133203950 [Saccostrea echinata]|uniref:uncharacterized protein LOC133203950 n=1 Tax=Saccostrea echinata TaxID=191078 RepID=UPI002A83C9E0|nr:uncharacterized protein LOC133203950 [Saccostrea echinata]
MNIDRQGRIVKCFAIDDIWGSSSHALEKNGNLLLINDERVERISPDGFKSTIIAPEWSILSICTSGFNGHIILGLYILIDKGSKTKLARYNNKGTLLSEIEYYQNKRLYVSPLYLSENINMSICTADIDTCLVRAVDKSGELLFTYDGQPKQVDFFPTGICNDIFGHILVCNRHKSNPSVHLLDINGKLKSIILNQSDGITDPWGICVDTEGRIYLGQHDCSFIKVYEYLEDIVDSNVLV